MKISWPDYNCIAGFVHPKIGFSYDIRIFANKTRVMVTKLTLTVQKEIIEKAKLYAKHTGRSLSALIEDYLETVIRESGIETISPKLKKIVGAVKLPENFDEEKELRSYFEDKHL